MDMIDIAIAKAFATKVAAGFSKVEVDGMTINFTLNDGTTTSLTVPTPADGVSVTDIDIDENGNLICTMSDETEINAGKVTPTKGVDYYTPEEIEEVKEDILTDLQRRIDLLTSEYTTVTSENSNNIIIEDAINYYNQGNIKVGSGTTLEQETTEGKQLLNYRKTLIPGYTTTYNGITYTINTDYSVKCNGTATGESVLWLKTIALPANTYTRSKHNSNTSIKLQCRKNTASGLDVFGNPEIESTTATLEEETLVYVRIYIANGTSVDETIYPMIEQGSTATDYEPYTGGQPSPNPDYPQDIKVVEGECGVEVKNEDNTKLQTYPITLPEGMFLGSIGTASNYIYGEKNNWINSSILHKRILNGTENWTKASFGNNLYQIQMGITALDRQNEILVLSDYFRGRAFRSRGDVEKNIIYVYNTVLYIRNTDFDTVEELKTWLTQNNVKVYVVTNTSTQTKITDQTLISQLNNIADSLQTYKGGTVVFTSGENLAPNIQFDYFTNLNESSSNKVTNISNESTDEQYPSAKAVYNYVETKLASFNSSNNTLTIKTASLE